LEENKPKGIAILGSTGSIGTQALEVIRENPNAFRVEVLTAHSNADLLLKQALEFKPNCVVIGLDEKYDFLKDRLFDEGVKVFCGAEALSDVVQMDDVEMVLTAMVGYAGLLPTISAIKAKKHIALANKETLVVAGEIITKLALENNVNIYPVDSEHSAIFQCLVGDFHNDLEKIILTASGGPFRGMKRGQLEKVTVENALKHPNWEMGAKITIDSASLMNKGLEVIEAKWLFNLSPQQIDVVVHPQSIIHSMVQFTDGSIKAQMGVPDMKLPIQYAMSYPVRLKNNFKRFSFLDYPELTFEKPDTDTFKNLQYAFDAMEEGGNAPCILNAANEVAVEAFLKKQVSFLGISNIVHGCLEGVSKIVNPNLEALIETDSKTREFAKNIIQQNKY
jgi:1-deoxy-D-xylulose-5-phosphate reductoisomerase